jgi:hypothetical protein
MIRALIYIAIPARRIDERGFTVAKAIREARHPGQRISQPRLKELFTEQFLLLKIDPARGIAALPELLPADMAVRREALAELKRVVAASGSMSDESARRLVEVEALFDLPPETVTRVAEPTLHTLPAKPPAAVKLQPSASAKTPPSRAAPARLPTPKGPPPKGARPKMSPPKVH